MAGQIAYRTEPQCTGVTGDAAGELVSHTFFEAELCIKDSDETIKIPVQNCTRVKELKEVVQVYLGYVDLDSVEFTIRVGSFWRKASDEDRVSRKTYIKGLKSFKMQVYQYPHPHGIIGAGYSGIKQAMILQNVGYKDFILWDRYDVVGGHTWLEMANRSTKLQTEFPTYHVWYGQEFSYEGSTKCGGPPTANHSHFPEIWPNAEKVAEHFQYAAKEYGLLQNSYLGTNVERTERIGKLHDMDRYFVVDAQPVIMPRRSKNGGGAMEHQLGGDSTKHRFNGDIDPKRDRFTTKVSTLSMWPGALVFPRPVHYKGEEMFGGPMDFAVEMRFDYSNCAGKKVAIIGHGAFTMENIRTCLEVSSKYIWVVCRKVNLTCPRPVSWFINQGIAPVPAAQILDMLDYAYPLTKSGGTDIKPWEVHSVMANRERTHATIWAKTRFGIGDVYFLAQAYGLCEVVVAEPRRCSYQCLHLDTGAKIECEAVLKCTGCLGDWKVDQVLNIQYMKGQYVNGDVRMPCTGEADGINAASFALTTGGPGYYGGMKAVVHFFECPNDWQRLVNIGILEQLPTHRAGEPDEEFPAYFFTAAHAQSSGIMIGGASPLLGAKMATAGDQYKNYIQNYCLPPERLLSEAMADWRQYEDKFRETGLVPKDAAYIPYPYTLEILAKQTERLENFVKKKWNIS